MGIKSDVYDDTYEKNKNLIIDSISPNAVDEILLIEMENNCITIKVSNMATDKPYYLTKYGRIQKGVYIRKGPSSIQINQGKIDRMYSSHHTKLLVIQFARHPKYEFSKLKTRFRNQKNVNLSDIKMLNLDLLTENEKITKLGVLFADENATDISVSKFEGISKGTRLIYTRNFGDWPLYESFEQIINLLDLEFPPIVTSIKARRYEEREYDFKSLREVLLNAFVHNDYSLGFPKVYIFSDRVEYLHLVD